MKKYYGVVVVNVKNWKEYKKYAELAGPELKKQYDSNHRFTSAIQPFKIMLLPKNIKVFHKQMI